MVFRGVLVNFQNASALLEVFPATSIASRSIVCARAGTGSELGQCLGPSQTASIAETSKHVLRTVGTQFFCLAYFIFFHLC